jgi:hypothetical protein
LVHGNIRFKTKRRCWPSGRDSQQEPDRPVSCFIKRPAIVIYKTATFGLVDIRAMTIVPLRRPTRFDPSPSRESDDSTRHDAGPGWNACTGLGVPKGAEIVAALAAVPIA